MDENFLKNIKRNKGRNSILLEKMTAIKRKKLLGETGQTIAADLSD
jgi:hypothetical protein